MICSELGYQKKDGSRLVDSFFEIIKDELVSGSDVLISGFGKWSVKGKRARRGRNPQTGDTIVIDVRKIVVFKPSVRLREQVQ